MPVNLLLEQNFKLASNERLVVSGSDISMEISSSVLSGIVVPAIDPSHSNFLGLADLTI